MFTGAPRMTLRMRTNLHRMLTEVDAARHLKQSMEDRPNRLWFSFMQ